MYIFYIVPSSSWLYLELVYLCVYLCRSSAGIQQSLLVTESVQDTGTEWLEYVDPNEPRYCLCNQVGATPSENNQAWYKPVSISVSVQASLIKYKQAWLVQASLEQACKNKLVSILPQAWSSANKLD